MRIALIWMVCTLLPTAVRAEDAARDALQIRLEVRSTCDIVFKIKSFSELVALFGEPLQHEIRSEHDPHTGKYRVELHHATFAGVQAFFAIAETMGPEMQWQQLVLEKPGKRIPPQTWIGRPLSEVVAQLDPPDRVADNQARYACDENNENKLQPGKNATRLPPLVDTNHFETGAF